MTKGTRNNKYLLLTVLLLALIAGWFFYSRNLNPVRDELRDFAVKDTGSVVKIFIADKSGKSVLLERKSNYDWSVDKDYWARPDAIKLLLATMHDVEVRSPVGKKAYNNIITSIASKGLKVEVYNSQGKIKTYYVGGPTMDQYGTYMYIENSSVPFITHIPGFNGYLTPRYIVDRGDWIVKNVFRLTESELQSLAVADRERPGFAFRIERKENSSDFILYDGFDQSVNGVIQDKILSYLQFFKILNFEGAEKSLSPNQRDSLRATVPFRSIVIKKTGGETSRIDLWRRPITSQTVNLSMEDGTPFSYDVDRMTAALNGDTSLIVVQYFSYEKLFRKPSDFQ